MINSIETTANVIIPIFITIFIIMFVFSLIIIIVSLVKQNKFNNKHINKIMEYQGNILKNKVDEDLPPLSKQFENEVLDDVKKVYKLKCPYCGTKYTSDNSKCPSCGARNNE